MAVTVTVVGLLGQQPSVLQAVGGVTVVIMVTFLGRLLVFEVLLLLVLGLVVGSIVLVLVNVISVTALSIRSGGDSICTTCPSAAEIPSPSSTISSRAASSAPSSSSDDARHNVNSPSKNISLVTIIISIMVIGTDNLQNNNKGLQFLWLQAQLNLFSIRCQPFIYKHIRKDLAI